MWFAWLRVMESCCQGDAMLLGSSCLGIDCSLSRLSRLLEADPFMDTE